MYQNKMTEYNRTLPTETDLRQRLLKDVFAEIGDECTVETPLNANWGCKHVHLGKGIYINSNVTFVDDEHIYIGDYTMISPNVVFTTSGHPTCQFCTNIATCTTCRFMWDATYGLDQVFR